MKTPSDTTVTSFQRGGCVLMVYGFSLAFTGDLCGLHVHSAINLNDLSANIARHV